jgi:hypothetical protein
MRLKPDAARGKIEEPAFANSRLSLPDLETPTRGFVFSAPFVAHPVALTGRVYCWVEAGAAGIVPGDLLTTSEAPGHAMKVADHAQAMGAIIGKAMTPLVAGEKGLVMVLVSLQ